MSVRSTRLSLSRRPILGALALLAITAAPSTSTAQTMSAEWAFAPRGIFADQRVILSMQLQMETGSAEITSGVALDYHDPMGNFAVDQVPTQDALPLLMAAGILGHEETQASGIAVSRACRVWSDPGLEEVRDLLGAELARVWMDLGVAVAPCEAVADPTEADLLVFAVAPAGVDFAGHDPGGSFLVSAPMPGAIPGAGTGGGGSSGLPADGPSPASTGSLGPQGDATEAKVVTTTGALLVLLTLAVARLATRNRTVDSQ